MEPLGLVSETVVSCHVHAENWTLILRKSIRYSELMSLFDVFFQKN